MKVRPMNNLFYLLYRFSVSEAVLLLIQKLLCLRPIFPVQQLFLIGMICTFMQVHHKEFTMVQKVLLPIVLLYLNFIRVITNNQPNTIIFKWSSSKIYLVLFNINIFKQLMEVLVVPSVYKVIKWKTISSI